MSVFADEDTGDQPTQAGDLTEPAAGPPAGRAADQVAGHEEVVRLPIDPAEPMACWLATI